MSRPFAPRVAIVNASGDRLRHIPGEAARVLVNSGIVTPVPSAGRIREVSLAQPASTFAQRIGEPTAGLERRNPVRSPGETSR
jgi:hypothetical protein